MTEEKLIQINAGLIYKIANKYFYGVENEDLFQAGRVGILEAYENYQKNGTTKFSTYAFSYIFGEMYKLATQKQIKVSRDLLKLYKLIEETRYALAQKENRIVTNEEIALYLEKDVSIINQAIQAGTIIVSSLDKSTDDSRSIYETIASKESISLDDKIAIHDGLSSLENDEKQILEYRYFEDLTQSEVARKLNMTQVMVSRYEKKGINKMRKFMSL